MPSRTPAISVACLALVGGLGVTGVASATPGSHHSAAASKASKAAAMRAELHRLRVCESGDQYHLARARLQGSPGPGEGRHPELRGSQGAQRHRLERLAVMLVPRAPALVSGGYTSRVRSSRQPATINTTIQITNTARPVHGASWLGPCGTTFEIAPPACAGR